MLEVAERVKVIVDGVRVVVDAGVIQVVLVRSAVDSIGERPSVGTAREKVEELESWVVIEPVGVAVDVVVWGEGVSTDAAHTEVVVGAVVVEGNSCFLIALRFLSFSCRILCRR